MWSILVVLATLLSADVGSQTQPTNDDWTWLDKSRANVLQLVMPVDDAAFVTFRSYRDLYQGVPETYFRIHRDIGDGRIRAVVVRPDGKSLQQQLLDLHLADRGATAEELAARLKFRQSDVTQAQCPQLLTRVRELARVNAAPPVNDEIVLHPMIHRIVISAGLGSLDATLFDEHHPLVRWAVTTSATLDRCIRERDR